jgi:hypothetical protein
VSLGRRSFLRSTLAAPFVVQRETGTASRKPLTGNGGHGPTNQLTKQEPLNPGAGPDASGTPPHPDYPSQPEDWWKRAWTDDRTKAPFSRRGINHGCMFVADDAIELYRRRVGSYPDAQGALTTAQDIPPDSWDKIIGGPYVDGVSSERSGTLLDWAAAGYTGHAFRTPGCVIVPHGPTVPDGITWADFEKVAEGTLSVGGVNIRDMDKRMGERIKTMCKEAGKDIAEVVMRPNHEGMNQDTKLRFALTGSSRQLYLVGAANGRTTSQITETYNAAVAQWAKGLWEGAEHRIPIALSPAMAREPDAVPEDELCRLDGRIGRRRLRPRLLQLPPAGGVHAGRRRDDRHRHEHDDPGLLDTGQGARGGAGQSGRGEPRRQGMLVGGQLPVRKTVHRRRSLTLRRRDDDLLQLHAPEPGRRRVHQRPQRSEL